MPTKLKINYKINNSFKSYTNFKKCTKCYKCKITIENL